MLKACPQFIRYLPESYKIPIKFHNQIFRLVISTREGPFRLNKKKHNVQNLAQTAIKVWFKIIPQTYFLAFKSLSKIFWMIDNIYFKPILQNVKHLLPFYVLCRHLLAYTWRHNFPAYQDNFSKTSCPKSFVPQSQR